MSRLRIHILTTVLAVCMLAPSGIATAQKKLKTEKPDLEAIRRATLDPESRFFFPKLVALYQRNDTVMTPEEYRYFYLGYMFQEDYDPYRTSRYSGPTDHLRAKATHTPAECDTIIEFAEKTLKDNPFDLRQMSFLVHALKEKHKNMRAKIWEYRLQNILGAIKSTGTGENRDNAWYVVYPMHEYDIVQLLGFEATDATFIEPGYDYLTVTPDPAVHRRRGKVPEGFYFNVVIPMQEYDRKHPDDAESQPAEPQDATQR